MSRHIVAIVVILTYHRHKPLDVKVGSIVLSTIKKINEALSTAEVV
jgi:hypothetical protein